MPNRNEEDFYKNYDDNSGKRVIAILAVFFALLVVASVV